MPLVTRKLFNRVALWSLLWLVVIGSIGALFNWRDIRDDNRRADLASRGDRVPGVIFSADKLAGMRRVRRCGRGSHAVVQFKPANKAIRRFCVNEGLPPEYLVFTWSRPQPDTPVVIVYDRKDASRFFVAARDGTVPRRDLTGIWQTWLKRTLIMVALYSLGTAMILGRTSR